VDIQRIFVLDGQITGQFRYADKSTILQPSECLSYRMPVDFLHLSTGADATKLIDFMRMVSRLICINYGRFSQVLQKNSNLRYIRLVPFRVPNYAALRQGPQGCNGDELLVTCGRFDRVGI